MHPIPEGFARAMVEVWETEGAVWLERLPTLIDECARRWELKVGPPFEPLSYNYVAPAVRADGTEAVLKLGVPRDEIMSEMEALRLLDGHGIVRLLEADMDQYVMLLERLRPGTMLSNLGDDDEATSIGARVMRKLWRPAPPEHRFPSLADWFEGLAELRQEFDGGTGPFDERLVEEAETAARELLASTAVPMVLHGDFHHYNVLAAEREPWLAIDPKGIVGDPAFETGAFLYNALPDNLDQHALSQILARRVDRLAEELEIDRARILGWGVAQAVLSGWWSCEDHGYGWEAVMEVAAALSAIRASAG
jgi:streptomycin 6-kinase